MHLLLYLSLSLPTSPSLFISSSFLPSFLLSYFLPSSMYLYADDWLSMLLGMCTPNEERDGGVTLLAPCSCAWASTCSSSRVSLIALHLLKHLLYAATAEQGQQPFGALLVPALAHPNPRAAWRR
jgi:hypothetical protein